MTPTRALPEDVARNAATACKHAADLFHAGRAAAVVRRDDSALVRKHLALLARAVLISVLYGATSMSAETDDRVTDRMLSADSDGGSWPSNGRTFSENHFSPLRQIDSTNVQRLHLAWSYDLDVNQRADSQPLAINGIVYVAAGLSVVHALDGRTGALLWRYDPQVAKVAGLKLRPSWGIRGLAIYGPLVIVGTQDGRLIALDARTGKLIWSVMTLDPTDETTITGAPHVFKGKVLVGFGGGDLRAVRGAVNCYDARTGKHLWRFFTVPGDPSRGFEDDAMAMAAKTWTGRWWKYGGGGAVWNAITYDPELNRVYLGTGNGLPYNWKVRNPGGGDNLFLASIVALDADTGRYIWHYQQTPNESWDYDSAADIVLATLTLNGRKRQVLMQANKNGFFYILDRETGRLISAEKFDKVTWAERIDLQTGRPVMRPGARYENGPAIVWPSSYGAHNWPPMSYSPRTGLVYIPTIHIAESISTQGIDPKTWAPTLNTLNSALVYGSESVPTEEFGSALLAWDPIRQKSAWRVATPGTWAGGTMATDGNLVFQGHLDGIFNAFDAKSGVKRWTFDARVPVLGAAMSYLAAGKQYVTVLSGPSGPATANFTATDLPFASNYRNPRRVLTFTLDGKGETADAQILPNEVPYADPTFQVSPDLARIGGALFDLHCAICHGDGAVSIGVAPDLRASPRPLSADAFANVVKAGALQMRGMPVFDELGEEDLNSLRHYIRRQANSALTVADSER